MRLRPGRPRHGEVWWFDPDPLRGHEQGGRRPALVVSADGLNLGPLSLVVVCPLTRADRPSDLRVVIEPPEGGLYARSFVLVEHLRSIALERLGARIGRVSPRTVAMVNDRLLLLFDL